MRTKLLGVAVLGLLCAACVSVTPAPPSVGVLTTPALPTLPVGPTQPPVPTLPGLPSPTPDSVPSATDGLPTPTPTLPPLATGSPNAGGPTVVVVFGSGPNEGKYSLSGDPTCSHGVMGDDVWGAQYGNFTAGQGDISTVQITDEPDSTGNGDNRIVSAFIVVGPIFGGTNYTLSLDRFSGDFTREVADTGTSALIHIAGKTIESPLGPGNVPIDITINCPTVTRS